MNGPTKTFTFGNAKVIVNTPLAFMSKEERKQFFIDEWKKGNPVLKEIAEAAYDCLESINKSEFDNKKEASQNSTVRYSEAEIINSLCNYLKENKGESKYQYTRMKFRPTVMTIERRLGSWEKAIKLAIEHMESGVHE